MSMAQVSPAGQTWIVRNVQEVAPARHGLAEWLRDVAPSFERREDVLIAVNELVTNGVDAGLAVGRVWVKIDASLGAHGLAVRVRNQGTPYIPRVGSAGTMPDEEAMRGRGLAIVAVLAASFEIEGQIGGTEARVLLVTSTTDGSSQTRSN